MKQPKSTASRRKQSLSVEEELEELLSDPTLKPSLNFLGIREPIGNTRGNQISTGTETVSDTDLIPDTVSVPDHVPAPSGSGHTATNNKDKKRTPSSRTATGSVPDTHSIPDTHSATAHLTQGRYRRPGPKKAASVEEGHSLAEHSLYEALWKRAKPYRPDARIITIGFGAMSGIVRLSLNNCRQNIRSLIRKLALEELHAEQCDQKIGKTYLVYSPQAILLRRRDAKLEWVVRTRGVVFIDPETGNLLTPKCARLVSDTDPIPVLNRYRK
jgi:hypothetical protein